MIDSACRPSHQVILYIGGRRLLNDICGYGGIGRRAGFRFLCCKACGFESHYPHHCQKGRIFIGLNPSFYGCEQITFWTYHVSAVLWRLHGFSI